MDVTSGDLVAKATADLLRSVVVDCVECGAPIVLSDRAKLYCSPACRQTLKLVRYVRGAIADGRWENDPTIADAAQMRLAQILGGGYHETERRVSAKIREQVFERDRHQCVICSDPATEIDHIAGDANTMENLRSTCGTCNFRMAQEHLEPVPPETCAIAGSILRRIFAAAPVFPRDDHQDGSVHAAEVLADRRRCLAEHVATVRFMERLKRDHRFRAKVIAGPILVAEPSLARARP